MGTKKTGFTLEQHEQLGLEIQTMRDRMTIIGTNITNNYRQKDKVAEMAKATLNNLEKLRSQMEEMLFKEHCSDANREELLKVYYRALSKNHVIDPQPIKPLQK